MVTERVDALLSSCPPGEVSEREFWGAQYDRGLAWVRFPEGLGRLGIDARWQSDGYRFERPVQSPVNMPSDEREDRGVAWRDVRR